MIKNYLCLLLIFATFLQYCNLGNVLGQGGIFFLTDFTDGLHQISLPKYECTKNGAMQNLRLHFKMLEGFCHSTEGLLICYKSQLDGEKSTKFSQKFKIDKAANYSQISKLCKEKFGENNSAMKWNGILLHQDNTASRNFTLELSLINKTYHHENVKELTIELGVPSGLKINGLQIEPDKEEINLYKEFVENCTLGAFMEDFLGLWALGMDLLPIGNNSNRNLDLYVNRSCKCSTKAWFLADSSVREKNLKWEKMEYENDNGKCPADKMDQDELKLTEPLKANEMANISLELIKNGNQKYKIQLLHIWTEKTWEKYTNAIIDEMMNKNYANRTNAVKNWHKYNYGDLANITIYFESGQLHVESIGKSTMYNLSGFTIGNLMIEKNDAKFTIQIHQHEYFVDIGFIDQIVVNAYWLYNWWDQLRVNMFKFHGMNVLEPPNIIKNENNISKLGLPPYAFKLREELRGNQIIVLRALMSEKVKMNVKFLYNTRQISFVSGNFEYYVGEFIFLLSIQPSSEKYNESMQIWIANSDPEEKKRFGYPELHNFVESYFKPDQLFELRIRLPPRTFDAVNAEGKPIVGEEYKIYTSYHTEMTKFDIDKTFFPLWKINTIVVDGIQMVEAPTIQNLFDDKEENAKSTDYSINIRQMNSAGVKDGAVNLLLPGELITIRGQVPNGAQEFCINFCFHQENCMFEAKDKIGDHPINSHSQIGDIVLHIRVILNATNKANEWDIMKINSWLRGSKKWQKEIAQKHSLQWGDKFTLRVKIPDDSWVFRVQLDENKPLELEAKQITCVPESDKICRMPPWSVDHLQIYGDVEVPRSDITRENHRNMLATFPFVKQFENGLELGRKIVIDGEFTGDPNMKWNDNVLFRIGIYHDGIGNFQWIRKNIYVGEALLELDFLQNGKLKVLSYLNRDKVMVEELYSYPEKIFWHRKKQIHVEILPLAKINGKKILYYCEIRINNGSTAEQPFRSELPNWAADYLYIDNIEIGMFKLLEEPKYY